MSVSRDAMEKNNPLMFIKITKVKEMTAPCLNTFRRDFKRNGSECQTFFEVVSKFDLQIDGVRAVSIGSNDVNLINVFGKPWYLQG